MRLSVLPESFAARILLIDDSKIEYVLLEHALSLGTGWTLEWAESGQMGLDKLRAATPPFDLVLLDLVMPGLSGFDVLERMAADPVLGKIPVIVLTASSHRADQVRVLRAGADDFLVKPLEPEVARVRVRSLLESSRQQHGLEDLVEERAAQLAHADRLVSMGTLAAGMAHEINNPLTWLSGSLQTLERFAPVLLEELSQVPGWTLSPRLRNILDDFPAIAAEMQAGVQRISRIVAGLKSFSRSGGGRRSVIDLAQVVRNAMLLTEHHLKRLTVEVQVASGGVFANGISQEIEQVVINLLTNAVDAVGDRQDRPEGSPGRIGIAVWREGARACISVLDDGPGVPDSVRARLGDTFFTTKPPGKGTGLGISISRNIARSHGGELRLVPSERGAHFVLDLPAVDPPPKESS